MDNRSTSDTASSLCARRGLEGSEDEGRRAEGLREQRGFRVALPGSEEAHGRCSCVDSRSTADTDSSLCKVNSVRPPNKMDSAF